MKKMMLFAGICAAVAVLAGCDKPAQSAAAPGAANQPVYAGYADAMAYAKMVIGCHTIYQNELWKVDKNALNKDPRWAQVPEGIREAYKAFPGIF